MGDGCAIASLNDITLNEIIRTCIHRDHHIVWSGKIGYGLPLPTLRDFPSLISMVGLRGRRYSLDVFKVLHYSNIVAGARGLRGGLRPCRKQLNLGMGASLPHRNTQPAVGCLRWRFSLPKIVKSSGEEADGVR